MLDRCPVHEAEINNDTQTSAQEYAEYEKQEAQYQYVYNRLLSGKKVATFSAIYDLSEILSAGHDEFADLVNLDVDFMWEYKQGRLDKSLMQLIENKAHSLAKNISGVIHDN